MNTKTAFKTPKGRESVISKYDEIIKQWRVPFEILNVNTSYGETFIIRSGDISMPPLILLHGSGSNSAIWLDEVEEYAKHYCVYCIDIPGDPGKSEEKQYSLKNTVYFEWLNEIVDYLKLNKVSIIGISLGAWLAVGYTVRYHEKVKKLVLLSPSGIGSQRISFIFKALLLKLLGNWGYNKLISLINGGKPMQKDVDAYIKLISKNFNIRTEPVPIYSDNELMQLKMPILLFVGEKDVLLNSIETAKRISSLLPNVQVNLLPDYGHVIMGLKSQIIVFLLN